MVYTIVRSVVVQTHIVYVCYVVQTVGAAMKVSVDETVGCREVNGRMYNCGDNDDAAAVVSDKGAAGSGSWAVVAAASDDEDRNHSAVGGGKDGMFVNATGSWDGTLPPAPPPQGKYRRVLAVSMHACIMRAIWLSLRIPYMYVSLCCKASRTCWSPRSTPRTRLCTGGSCSLGFCSSSSPSAAASGSGCTHVRPFY